MSKELSEDEMGVDVDLDRSRGDHTRKPSTGEKDDAGDDDSNPWDDKPLTIAFVYLMGHAILRASWLTITYSLHMVYVRNDAVFLLNPELAGVSFWTAAAAGRGPAWAFHYHPVLATIATIVLGGVIYIVLVMFVTIYFGEADQQ